MNELYGGGGIEMYIATILDYNSWVTCTSSWFLFMAYFIVSNYELVYH